MQAHSHTVCKRWQTFLQIIEITISLHFEFFERTYSKLKFLFNARYLFFQGLKQHILECLLFWWRSKMCRFRWSKHGRLQSALVIQYSYALISANRSKKLKFSVFSKNELQFLLYCWGNLPTLIFETILIQRCHSFGSCLFSKHADFRNSALLIMKSLRYFWPRVSMRS